MDEQKAHRLILIVIIFNLFCTLILGVIEPVFGVLWLLMFVLICLIIRVTKPDLWNIEAKRVKHAVTSTKERLTGVPDDELSRDLNKRPAYRIMSEKIKDGIDLPINKDIFVIGRSRNSDCRIRGHNTVGREHCRIIYRRYSQEYYIEDLRSSNGTYLGTHKLEPFTQHKLTDGMVIIVGGCHLRFVRQ